MTNLAQGEQPDSSATRLLSAVLTTDEDVVFEVGVDGVVKRASSAAAYVLAEQLGLIGTRLSSLVHPEDLRRFQANARQQVLSGRAVDSLDVRIRQSDGSYKPVRARILPRQDIDGLVCGAVVSWREAPLIGDAGAAQAFATLAEATRVLLRSTSEQELLQQMCDAVCLAGGYPFSWYGRPVHDVGQSVEVLAVGGDDRGYTSSIEVTWGRAQTGQGPTGRALRTGATQVANNLAEDPRFAPWRSAALASGIECSIALPVRCDGEMHGALMVYASASNAFDAQAVELLEYLAADIGYGLSRLRSSAALVESEEQYRLLAENSSDVVFFSGPDMRLQWVSPSVTAITGWTREQLLGERIVDDYLHPEDVTGLKELIARSEPQQSLTRRMRLRCADGSYKWTSVTGRAYSIRTAPLAAGWLLCTTSRPRWRLRRSCAGASSSTGCWQRTRWTLFSR